MNHFHQFLFIYLTIVGSDAYRILAVFPFNSRSHNIFFEGISKGLANRGHQVDVISHFEMKNPPKNYKTIINLNGTRPNLMNNFTIEFAAQLGGDVVPFIAGIYGNDICDLMALEKMQQLIKNPPRNPPYDMIITESFGASCYIGLGYVLKVPVITVSSSLEYPWTNDALRNPDSTAFAPNILMNSAEITTFWDRLKNTISTQLSTYRFYRLTEEAQTLAMRKYLSPDIPNIREVESSASLTFVNSFHSLFGIRVRTPAFIDIAGVHIEENNDELSPDLQKWMDESHHGVIYFTLGSMVLIETLPKETLLAIYASFAKIAPIRVLMKIVNKEKLPPGLPNNILTSKWIPQIPVLKHKNIKLFITHGGLIGTEEALHFGVPMIGIPLYADQFYNVRIFVKKHMALWMDYRKITHVSFNNALNLVLNNPKYRRNAKKESRLFRDRPMSAMDTVDFWIGYIMRNGPTSLRSPAIELHWFQVALLDVYGFILLFFIIIICFILLIVKCMIRAFCKIGNHNKHDKSD